MTVVRYALLDGANVCQNVVLWDGGPSWSPPAGLTPTLLTVANTPNGCAPGYTFDGSVFVFGTLPVPNLVQLLNRAGNALANNDTYLAIPTPTQAQAIAQVASLTRQVNAIIRIMLNAVDTIADT